MVIQKQQAKEKLHKLVAPLLTMHNAHQLSLQALGAIQPKLNLSFSEVGATLRDGTIILQGVTGHFNNAKVPMHMSAASVYHHTFQLTFLCVLASGGDCNAAGAQAASLCMTAFLAHVTMSCTCCGRKRHICRTLSCTLSCILSCTLSCTL